MSRIVKSMVVVIPVAIGLAGLGVWAGTSSFSPIPTHRLLEIRVGASHGTLRVTTTTPPGTKMCCIKSSVKNCGYSCVSRPNCPRGTRTVSECQSAHCTGNNDPNSGCTGAAVGTVRIQSNDCTTYGGLTISCNDPPNTAKCYIRTTNYTILRAEVCKTGESLCANGQPTNPCE